MCTLAESPACQRTPSSRWNTFRHLLPAPCLFCSLRRSWPNLWVLTINMHTGSGTYMILSKCWLLWFYTFWPLCIHSPSGLLAQSSIVSAAKTFYAALYRQGMQAKFQKGNTSQASQVCLKLCGALCPSLCSALLSHFQVAMDSSVCPQHLCLPRQSSMLLNSVFGSSVFYLIPVLNVNQHLVHPTGFRWVDLCWDQKPWLFAWWGRKRWENEHKDLN